MPKDSGSGPRVAPTRVDPSRGTFRLATYQTSPLPCRLRHASRKVAAFQLCPAMPIGRERAAVQPLGEAPVVERVDVGQASEFAARRGRAVRGAPAPAPRSRRRMARCRRCDTGAGGSAGGAPCRAATVRAAPHRLQHDADRVRRGRLRGAHRLDDAVPHRFVGQAAEDREQVAEHVALVTGEGQVDEAEVEPGIVVTAACIVPKQPGAVVLGQVPPERVEQVIEVMARHLAVGQREASLDLVPQRVAVEHVARARHDVGPVAGLVLLQQPEVLVLLRQQPADGARDRIGASARRDGAVAPHVVHRDQPPQRRVDAAEIPEVGVAPLRGRRTSGSGRWPPAAQPARRGRQRPPARVPRRRCRTSPAHRSTHHVRRSACSGAPPQPRCGWRQECHAASGCVAAGRARLAHRLQSAPVPARRVSSCSPGKAPKSAAAGNFRSSSASRTVPPAGAWRRPPIASPSHGPGASRPSGGASGHAASMT